jgi:signal transduction histidine kinase/ActR/RegA family two-component response regulator
VRSRISAIRQYLPSVFIAAVGLALYWIIHTLVGAASPYVLLAMGSYVLLGVAVIWPAHRAQVRLDAMQVNASALDRSRHDLQVQVTDLEALHELSNRLLTMPNLNQQLTMILLKLVSVHQADKGLVSLYDPGTEHLSVVTSVGFDKMSLERLRFLRLGEGACGLACKERRHTVVADTEGDPVSVTVRDVARAAGYRGVHSAPLLSPSGAVLGVIAVHFEKPRESTAREMRLAELLAATASLHVERTRAQALAQEHDQRFRAVLESSAVPFAILAPVIGRQGVIVDFTFSYYNVAAATVMQRGTDDLLGKHVSTELPGTWEIGATFENYLAVALRKEVREFDLRYDANGIHGWFHVIAAPVQGQVAIWFADITQRRAQEEALRTADRRKDEFLAMLAHELRNPLAPIRHAAIVARKPAATASEKQWCYEVIDRQVQHMSHLLEDLLDVSRVTRDALPLRRQPSLLDRVMGSAMETAAPLLERKRHTVQLELNGELDEFDVDPWRLSQVISNLLTNAAKYTDVGGRITITRVVAGADLIIEVTDNGVGIAAEDLSTIFTLFAQAPFSHTRAENGLGIGLSLAKSLIELHGGRLAVASAGRGCGTTFTINIPACRVEPGSAELVPANVPVAAARRILLADDNSDAARALALTLEMDKHEVIVAHDGEEVLALFSRVHPDLVLLDIGMPRMSGYEVARRIRSESENGHVTLIAVSAWARETDRSLAKEAGFDHHLAKPVDPEELVRLLVAEEREAALVG